MNHAGCCVTLLTSTEVTEHVVALFGEGHLVNGVADVTGLQQVARILASFPAVGETLHIVVEPVHHVGTWMEKGQAEVQSLENGSHLDQLLRLLGTGVLRDVLQSRQFHT